MAIVGFPTGKFGLIYADPPWRYRNKHTGGNMKSGAKDKYPTMSLDEIKKLPVKSIAMKRSALFLWTTVPILPKAFEVMYEWGFSYRTALFWDKKRFGLGYWFRGSVEVLLMGIKGNVPAFRSNKINLIKAKSSKHSRKPYQFYEILERLNLEPKVELFARVNRPGWVAWGNEIKPGIQMRLF
jgi:N6-adenosine-specific RNA methylase IME4